MGGRGRGWQSSSFTYEQAQTLGIVGKDNTTVITAQPPTYPPQKITPIACPTSEMVKYRLQWDEIMLEYTTELTRCLQVYKNEKSSTDPSEPYNNLSLIMPNFNWSHIPSELKSKYDPSMYKSSSHKKKKTLHIEDHLKQLESKEENDTKEESSDLEINEDEDIPDEDEEMDDENDYGSNYFDNGEAFNEEDDNLEDGPVF